MYEINDTIVAISSPTSQSRVIIRISGPGTVKTANCVLEPSVEQISRCVMQGKLLPERGLAIDANFYFFVGTNSYTGQDLAEIHFDAGPGIAEAV